MGAFGDHDRTRDPSFYFEWICGSWNVGISKRIQNTFFKFIFLCPLRRWVSSIVFREKLAEVGSVPNGAVQYCMTKIWFCCLKDRSAVLHQVGWSNGQYCNLTHHLTRLQAEFIYQRQAELEFHSGGVGRNREQRITKMAIRECWSRRSLSKNWGCSKYLLKSKICFLRDRLNWSKLKHIHIVPNSSYR